REAFVRLQPWAEHLGDLAGGRVFGAETRADFFARFTRARIPFDRVERSAHPLRPRVVLEKLGKREAAEQNVREPDVLRRERALRDERGDRVDAISDDHWHARERALERGGTRRAQ